MSAIDNNRSSPSFIGSLFRFTGRMVYCSTLAVSGVALMAIGASGLYLNYLKLHEFYFEGKDGKGYGDVPFFYPVCNYAANFVNVYVLKEDPIVNTESTANGSAEGATPTSGFCESMGQKPFSGQKGLYGPASLAASLGGSAIAAIGCVYAITGGASLVGRSFDNFFKGL